MASTKTRRQAPPNVIMSTPPPQSRSKSKYSEVEKQGLVANFDIEVADKTAYFQSILSRTLASFRMREESEILAIPRELRGMTLKELESKWGGGWVGTLQKIRRESFEKKELIREERETKEREEVVKGKRKRNGTITSDNSPERSGKNPRRDAPTPSSKRKVQPPSSTTRSKATSAASKKGKTVIGSISASKGPSSLPQNHIFNPTLPPTPLLSSKSNNITSPLSKSKSSNSGRGNKPTSSGSSHPPSHNHEDDDEDESEDEEDEDDEEDDDDDDELPDPEVLEAKLLSTKTPIHSSKSSSRGIKKKRGPSLIFRQSLAPGSTIPLPNNNDESDGLEEGDSEEPLSNIELSDGRIISFNPFNLTPGRVERELNAGTKALSVEEKKLVQEKVHEQVVRSLKERIERWKV